MQTQSSCRSDDISLQNLRCSTLAIQVARKDGLLNTCNYKGGQLETPSDRHKTFIGTECWLTGWTAAVRLHIWSRLGKEGLHINTVSTDRSERSFVLYSTASEPFQAFAVGALGAGVPGASNGTPSSSNLVKAAAKSLANFSSSFAYCSTNGLNFLSQTNAMSAHDKSLCCASKGHMVSKGSLQGSMTCDPWTESRKRSGPKPIAQ